MILKEYIRQVLNEAVLGTKVEAILRHLRSIDDVKEMTDYLWDNFERAGKGSWRTVFIIDDDFVIKFDPGNFGDAAGAHNQMEAIPEMQSTLGYMLPKVYDHSDDYSWLLMERVTPIESDSTFLKVLGINSYSFFSLGELRKLVSRLEKLMSEGMDEEEAIVSLIDKYYVPEEYEDDWDDDMSDTEGMDDDEIARKKWRREGFGAAYREAKEVLNNPFIKGMREIYRQYGLGVWDIRAGNVGLTNNGKPVILDWGIEKEAW